MLRQADEQLQPVLVLSCWQWAWERGGHWPRPILSGLCQQMPRGRPRTEAASAAPPLIPEPLLPPWLSCPWLYRICISGRPTWILPCPTRSPYHLYASPKPCNTGNHAECQFFRVPGAEYCLFHHFPQGNCALPQCVLVALWAPELQGTLHVPCAGVQAILSFLLLP